MANLVIPKSRRIRFHLALHIHDLNNVPLVSGTSFIKWHLPSSTAADHRGRTPKSAIKDHRVVYDYAKTIPVRLTVSKDGVLQGCEVHFEVVQEYSAGGRAERLRLGEVRLNLAEYARGEEGGQGQTPGGAGSGGGGSGGAGGIGEEGEGIIRRYLMQESKINSTLKIGISLTHLEGTRDYIAPALRTAPVFGGITGIISSAEPVTAATTAPHANGGNTAAPNDPSDALPNLSSTNREMGEMQDLYRRTLAAYWASQPGEMRADECIEDIFAGGDGWGKNGRPADVADMDAQQQQGRGNERSQPGSASSTPTPEGLAGHAADGRQSASRPGSGKMGGNAGRGFVGGSGGMGFVGGGGGKYLGFGGGKHQQGKAGGGGRQLRKRAGEVDEFGISEDLRSWVVGEGLQE